ncbi:hypothetical protein EJ02DRAFT_355608 [Clathrospora elynae]|uniref:Uncharacterized protein n=1 Tax=Clathrospora elynae TaxID=706981 RepID=A0A6A5SDG1_9PLEO|nr:hypothetical protein EJ02DRAFT_355608 [Clathrospora elynae]
MKPFEYNLSIHWPYPSCFKRLQNSLLFKGYDPGLPEQKEEVAFLYWDKSLALVKVGGKAFGVSR